MTRPTQLSRLTSRLAALRRRRRTVRLGAAAAGFATAALWILALAFAMDWSLSTDRPQRVVLIACCAAASLLAYRRLAAPFFGIKEDLIDMALLVERRSGLSGGLVDAIEFERPAAESWGSSGLRSAVIQDAADLEPRLEVLKGFSRRPFLRRAALLAATAAILSAAAFRFPEHTRIFLSRLALGSEHYPTRTVIEDVHVNDRRLFPLSGAMDLRLPFGTPLRVSVIASGELPPRAEARLVPLTGSVSILELAPSSTSGNFEGSIQRLSEDVTLSVIAGDAWTERATIRVVPRPAVAAVIKFTPPEYARRRGGAAEVSLDAQSASVPEGSRVAIRFACANKSLVKASAMVDGKEVALRLDSDGRAAILLPEGTPLEEVREPIRYSAQVEDEDGLGLETPLAGVVRVEEDQRPRVVAALLTQVALPIAKPRISYGAVDDFGVTKLEAVIQITRADGKTEEARRTVFERGPEAPLERVLRGRHALDLAPLALVKGDQISVTIVATDFRGTREPLTSPSGALTLNITDERGVLAAMTDSDERTAKQLDLIIERQLGIGGQP